MSMKKMFEAHDDLVRNIGVALIRQVTNAVPKGGTEQDVVTYISRTMWSLWCEFINEPPGPPSETWSLTCRRVYGSRTVVVNKEGKGMWSFSKADQFKHP